MPSLHEWHAHDLYYFLQAQGRELTPKASLSIGRQLVL
jgi:hypothetical protein